MVSPKQDIRRRVRARRDALPALERAAKSRRIHALLLEFLGPGVHRAGLYAAIGSEVETRPIFVGLRARGIEVCFPRCRRDTLCLDFVPVVELDDLEPGHFGIPEPAGTAVPLDTLDVLIIPGVAFDPTGGRIGYGGGYYDSTLDRYRGTVIGIAFADQVVGAVPRETHDRTVDAVLTEEGVLSPASPAEVACRT